MFISGCFPGEGGGRRRGCGRNKRRSRRRRKRRSRWRRRVEEQGELGLFVFLFTHAVVSMYAGVTL